MRGEDMITPDSTVQEWLPVWLEAMRGKIAAMTLESYQSRAMSIANYLPDVKLKDVDEEAVRDMMRRMKENGFSYQTTRSRAYALKRSFAYAESVGIFQKSPLKKLHFHTTELEEGPGRTGARNRRDTIGKDVKQQVGGDAEKHRTQPADPQAVEQLFEENHFGTPLHIPLRLCYACDLSAREALSLKWEDVDFGKQCLHVQKLPSRGQRRARQPLRMVKTFQLGPTEEATLQRWEQVMVLLFGAKRPELISVTSEGKPILYGQLQAEVRRIGITISSLRAAGKSAQEN